MAEVFCGLDWGEQSHYVALVDASGRLIGGGRIEDSILGLAALRGMMAGAGDRKRRLVPIATETPHGLIISALVRSGRPVYAINPMAVARYRERHSAAGRKSDAGDAMVLANILRTDLHLHRPAPADSELVRAITVVARAHQDAVHRRTSTAQHLRIVLRDYFPAFLKVFALRMDGLYKLESRLLLGLVPTPTLAAKLTVAQVTAVLRKGGRKRAAEIRAEQIVRGFAVPQLRQPDLVEKAMADQAIALLEILDTGTANVDTLALSLNKLFRQHPDHEVICSFAGLGPLTGARILGEIGDDRRRFTTARGLKAYAGAAPVTKASGKTTQVNRRYQKNNRLLAAGMLWAAAAILRPGPERDHYLKRRATGDLHMSALRNLFNRMLGQLHHCLQRRELFDEASAYPEKTQVL